MSGGSPRKLLRRALDALNDLEALAERYPDARERLEAAVGAAGWAGLLEARDRVREAHAAVDHANGSADATES